MAIENEDPFADLPEAKELNIPLLFEELL